MIETPKPQNAMSDFIWILFILIILAIAWYGSGGQLRPEARSGPFLPQPQQKHSQSAQKQTEEIFSSKEKIKVQKENVIETTESIYKDSAKLIISSASKNKDPNSEYIEIRALSSNKNPIPISDWRIEGKRGLDIKIGKGVYLIFSGQVNPKEKIFLNPGEKAIIITGKSPIGVSFRLNICTGYFEQFQDFKPRLPKICPYLEDEYLPAYLNDNCLDYIERLPRCELHIKSFPLNINGQCQNYINENVNYKSCVDVHKNDSNFYKPEWRIYLGRNEELWKEKRETIILWDEQGKIIDQKSY